MIRIFFLFWVVVLISNIALSQKLDSLIINRQSHLDSLPILFPSGIIEAQHVIITGNNIQDIRAFRHIEQIAGSLIIQDVSLDSIVGLSNILIDDEFRIENNNNLVWIEKFLLVRKISTFKVMDCPALKSLDFMDNVEFIFTMHIEGNTKELRKIDHFPSLKYLFRFSLLRNTGIDSILFDNDLGDVGIVLIQNEDLTFFKAFNGTNNNALNVNNIANDIIILENTNLRYLDFSNSTLTFNAINISSNPQLATLKIGENANFIGSVFELVNNTNLENFEGYNDTKFADFIQISQNDNLQNLNCFKKLKKTINLTISYNNTLKNLSGSFSNLDTIGSIDIARSGLYITHNRSLNNIEEFGDVKFMNYIKIQYNKRLGLCSIMSICEHIEIGRAIDVNADNSPGCRTINQILAGCTSSSSEEVLSYNEDIVYPNPTSDILFIKNVLNTEIEIIAVLSADGKKLPIKYERYENKISTSLLPKGNYWVIYKTGQKIHKSHFVKI